MKFGKYVVCGLHCDSKNVPRLTCYNLYTHGSIAAIFGINVLRTQAIKMYFIFPPHLTSPSALPGEQETRKLRIVT